MQDVYQPCPCGSGAKLKFCCYKKVQEIKRQDPIALIKKAADFKVSECLIREDWEDDGLAVVLVVRNLPNQRYLFALYSVDTYCLGVKDAFCNANTALDKIEGLKRRSPYDFVPIEYEKARNLILGAVDYARSFGFEPHEDWYPAKYLIEPDAPYEKCFQYGKDGKPCYISGPHDNPTEILEKLGRATDGDFGMLVGSELPRGVGLGSTDFLLE